ncbi:MAG: DUF1573 domain-containing protein [Gemmatimonadota bacterium]|nr:MAG: DUF1573 domain-containing protein [Gemmatimonadota bacterium]
MKRLAKAVLGVSLAIIVLIVIGVAVVWRSVSGPETASFTDTHDFGDIVQGEQLEHVFVVRNEKANDLRVDRVVVSYASEVLAVDSVLPAGGDARIRLRVDTKSLRGNLKETARIYFTDESDEPMWLYLRGRVVLPVEIAPQDRVYFFTVKGEGPEQEIQIINHQNRPLQVLGVTSSNPLFRVESEEVERQARFALSVTLDPTTPLGRHESTITVSTDSPEYPSLQIEALAIVEDIVSTSLSRVDFPKVLYDQLDREVISRKVVLVKKHEGQDFEVVRATTDLPFLSVEVAADKPGASYLVYVRIMKGEAERGEFEGTLVIETNDSEVPELRLPITGTIL